MPAFDNPIFEHAAKSLAAMRQPDFAGFSAAEVDAAMIRVFTFNGPDPAWLAQMKARIQELSSGLTQLEDANPEEFPYRVKTPGASYHRLLDRFRIQLMIISPSQPPFLFVNRS